MTIPRLTCALPELRAKAGAYAGRMARLWPAPHGGYFALPAQRRHLAHIYVARIGRAPGLDRRAFARDFAKARLADVLRRWAPDAPLGLPAACRKMGEVAWRPKAYRRLVGLMGGCPNAAETLRHADEVTIALVDVLDTLPVKLRRLAVARHVRTEAEARMVREAVVLATRLRPEAGDVAAALAVRLARADGRERFFEMVLKTLRPKALPTPFEATGRLRPLVTPADVEEAGRRFRNCLSECLERAVFGRSAFVEWRGDEPAVMELVYEGAAGWRLETLLGFGNRDVSGATRRAVLAELADQQVRAGFDARALVHQLEDLAEYAA